VARRRAGAVRRLQHRHRYRAAAGWPHPAGHPRAQTLDLRATAERLQDLTQRARSGTLAPSEVQHGTFSISNHGVSGSLIAAPIVIPQPQSAILGVGKLERRPVARDAR